MSKGLAALGMTVSLFVAGLVDLGESRMPEIIDHEQAGGYEVSGALANTRDRYASMPQPPTRSIPSARYRSIAGAAGDE